MSIISSVAPLRYSPAVEKPEEDEAETTKSLIDTMRKISEKTYEDGGHALRSVHAKSHGLLQAEMQIFDGLDSKLAQGLFSRPARFPVVMRFSTLPGDLLPDSVSTPRGLAIKIIGVPGERLPGSEGDSTQDLVLVNGPAFSAPTAKAFLRNLKLLAATTDRVEGLKEIVSSALRGIVSITGGEPSPTIATLGGQPETHILGETFYTQVPLRYGDYMAKISVAPVSAELTALTKAPVDLEGRPNGLRDAVIRFFQLNGGEWDVRVQMCTNLDDTPIEDAAQVWSEEKSPYFTVARIRATPQKAWSEARSAAVDDGLAFSPWHGLAAHRPLGSIMRARKAAYEMSSRFRSNHNCKEVAEPKSFENLPE